jgi:catechol 2,3-dioxygenase-like lactoylglutathione lyase family enzyme
MSAVEQAQATTVKQIHCIHHVLFPTTDMDRTAEWYGSVFGMRRTPVTRKTGGLEVLGQLHRSPGGPGKPAPRT